MATVLVVEDEGLIRDLVAEDLQEAGFTVVVAKNADHAIAILEVRQDIHCYLQTSTCRVQWTG